MNVFFLFFVVFFSTVGMLHGWFLCVHKKHVDSFIHRIFTSSSPKPCYGALREHKRIYFAGLMLAGLNWKKVRSWGCLLV